MVTKCWLYLSKCQVRCKVCHECREYRCQSITIGTRASSDWARGFPLNEVNTNCSFDPSSLNVWQRNFTCSSTNCPMSRPTACIWKRALVMCYDAFGCALSEISRTTHAAKTAKLTVREIGHSSRSGTIIYNDSFTVIVDCYRLTDEPRMQLVGIHRDGNNKNTARLRVIARVTIDKLVNYMAEQKMELYQSPGVPVLAYTRQVWGFWADVFVTRWLLWR